MKNGVQVAHKKGEYKLRDGNPYYETLGDRDAYGKELLHWADTVTIDGSKLNKFDPFDADGLKRSVASTAIKTILTVAPMFIPSGVGQIYGIVTASAALARVIPLIAKGIDSAVTGSDDNDFGRAMTKWENWAESNLNWATTSDYGKEHLVSFETLGNLVSAISGQLFQQKWIGTIPAILNKGGDAVKNVEAGRNLALAYMAVTSAQDSYSEFKQAGATDRIAGLGMIASMSALYGLMNQEYFRNWLFKGTYMDENGVKVPAAGVAKTIKEKTLKAGTEKMSTKEASTIFSKIKNKYNNAYLNSFTKNEWLERSFAEATEEVMEEVSTDAIKCLTLGFDSLGIKTTEVNKDLDFGFSGKDILQRYGMSFAGGFIGGGIFHAQTKYDTWYNERYRNKPKNDIADDDMKKLVYLVAQGHGDDLRDYYTKWWRKGLLGNPNLTVDSESMQYLDGKQIVHDIARGKEFSQNDLVYSTLMNMINSIEQTIRSECGGYGWTVEDLNKIAVRGFNPDNKQILTAHNMVELGTYSRFVDDFYDTIAQIISVDGQLKAKIESLSKNPSTQREKEEEANTIKNDQEVKALQDRLKELRERRDSFLNGERNKYYAGQSLYLLNPNIRSNFSEINDVEDYTTLKYGRNYDSLPDEQKEAYKKEFEQYKKLDGDSRDVAGYDLYLACVKQWGPQLEEIAKKLKGVYADNVHDENLEGLNYQNFIKEYNHTVVPRIHELTLLDKDSKLTKAQEAELTKLIQRKNELEGIINNIEKNPSFVLLSTLQKGKYSGLNDLLISNDVNDKLVLDVYSLLKDIYSKTANKHGYLANDDQLNGFFNLIKGRFNAVDINQKFAYGLKQLLTLNPNLADINSFFTSDVAEEAGDPSVSSMINPYQEEIIKSLKDAISYLGINNKTFVDKLKEIQQKLVNDGIIEESGVEEIIKAFLPNIGTRNVLDVIREFDKYKRNITYSGFNEVLNNIFKTTIGGETKSLLDVLEEQSKNLAESESIMNYIIRNEDVLSTFSEERFMPLFKSLSAVLQGAWDNTNALINSFEGGDEIGPLVEIEEEEGRILLKEASDIFARMDFLKKLSDRNKEASMRIQRDIEINMRPKFLQKLITPEFAKEFDKVFKPHALINRGNDDEGKPLEDLIFNPGAASETPYLLQCWQQLIPDDFDWDEMSEGKYTDDIYPIIIQMEQIIGDVVRNSDFIKTHSDREVAKVLRSLVCADQNDLYKMVSTPLSTDKDVVIEDYDLLWYLTRIIAVPSLDLALEVREGLEKEFNDDERIFGVAPVYGQEMCINLMHGMILNTGLFNAVLDEIAETENIKLDDSITDEETRKAILKWYDNHPVLHNFITVLGGAGVGKTKGVARFIVESLALRYQGSMDVVQVVGLAPTEEQSKNLVNGLNLSEVQQFNKDRFMEEVLGIKGGIKNYYTDEESGMVMSRTKVNLDESNNPFDSTKKLKLLILDEITLFSKDELSQISKWAENRGIVVLALGDVKQNAAKVKVEGKENDGKTKESYKFSGIEDCFYIKSPELTASLRVANEAKLVNYVNVNTILQQITRDYARNPHWHTSDLDSKVPSSVSLVYYESPDKQTLYGEKIVKEVDDVYSAIDRFKELVKGDTNQIAIVTDSTEKYNTKYAKDIANNVIKVISTSSAQGGEFKYVIVDKDFAEDNKINNSVSKFSILRDLYTLSQRSSVATVILDRNLTDNIKIKDNASNALYNQMFQGVDDKQVTKFKEWTLRKLSKLNRGENQNNALLKNMLEDASMKRDKLAEEAKRPDPAASTIPSKSVSKTNETNNGKKQGEEDDDKSSESPTPSVKDDIASKSDSSDETPESENDDDAGRDSGEASIDGSAEQPEKKGTVSIPVEKPKGTRRFLRSDILFDYLLSPDLKEQEAKYNSLYNVIKKRRGRDLTDEEMRKYITTVNFISSFVKEDMDFNDIDIDNIANLIERDGRDNPDLRTMLGKKPEVWIVPYNGKSAMVVARYSGQFDTFDIPLGFSNTKSFGRYNGKFTLQKHAIAKTSKEHKMLEQLLAENPFLMVSKQFGILCVDEERVKNENLVDAATKRFILNTYAEATSKKSNNGKMFGGLCCSPALARKYLTTQMFKTDKGKSISNWDKYDFIALQKNGDVKTIFNYIQAIMKMIENKDISSLVKDEAGSWFNRADSREYVQWLTGQSLDDLTSGKTLKQSIDRKNYQIIPQVQLPIMAQAVFESELGYQAWYNSMIYLTSRLRGRGKRRGETRGLVFINDDQAFAIEPNFAGDGSIVDYSVRRWDLDYQHTENEVLQKIDPEQIDLYTKDSYSDLCQLLFGEGVTSAEVSFIKRVKGNDAVAEAVYTLVPNKALCVLLSDYSLQQIEELSDLVQQNDHYKYGCFLNLDAKEGDKSFPANSLYGRYTGNNTNLVVQIESVTPEIYTLDESEISVDGNQSPVLKVNGRPAYRSLAELLAEEKIESDPLLDERFNQATTDEERLNVLNWWLESNNPNWKNVKQLHFDEQSKLYYSDTETVDKTNWLRRNFRLRTRNLSIPDSKMDVDINTLDSFKFGKILVYLQDAREDWFVRLNSNDEIEYVKTSSMQEFDNLTSNRFRNNPNLKNTLRYIMSLPCDYNVDMDNIVDDAMAELNEQVSLGNQDAIDLQNLLFNYLETRLKNDEC